MNGLLSNTFLNIGPTGDGSVPEASVTRMREIGAWLEKNGEAIYGTTASPLDKLPWDGRITTKGKTHYLHVFSRPGDGSITVSLPQSQATLLATGQKLETNRTGDQLTIQLPDKLPDPIATVIRLDP